MERMPSSLILIRRWSGEIVQFHLGRVLFGLETNNEAWPAPKLDQPINDKPFGLLDCFGIVGADQGRESYKAAVKTNGKSSVFCHRSHPALKTQLAARASRGLYTSEHNSNGIFKIKMGPFTLLGVAMPHQSADRTRRQLVLQLGLEGSAQRPAAASRC
jgi:hypothetical protein